MSVVAPAPGSRGEVILQPNYFTSSIFVKTVRDDITTLIHSYHEKYTSSTPTQPFSLFKDLWSAQGWSWMHLFVYDHRAREAFLNVVHRLFLERMVKTEAPFSRAVALFGLYTFYFTQPGGTAPRLFDVAHIPIPSDQFASLKVLSSSMNVNHLQPLQPHVSYVLSVLMKERVFFITACSEVGPLNPRDIPRELFVEGGSALSFDLSIRKKKGRPTKRDKSKKARLGLDTLDKWLHDTPPPMTIATLPLDDDRTMRHPLSPTLRRYQVEKSHILNSIDPQSTYAASSHAGTTIEKSNQFVLERLKEAESLFPTEMTLPHDNQSIGVARVERAVMEFVNAASMGGTGGALSLLEGAGNLKTSRGTTNYN